jgi:hypothetical protein
VKWDQVKKGHGVGSLSSKPIHHPLTPPNSPKPSALVPRLRIRTREDIYTILCQLQSISSLPDGRQINAALTKEVVLRFSAYFDMTQQTMSVYQRIVFHVGSNLSTDRLRCAIERTRTELAILSFMMMAKEIGAERAIDRYRSTFKNMCVSNHFFGRYIEFCGSRSKAVAACDAALSVLGSLREDWCISYYPFPERVDEKSRTGSLKLGSKG